MLNFFLGDEAANAARARGTENVVVFRDLLSVGRSDLDPARHLVARCAQWNIDEREAREGHIDLADVGDGPITLWSSSTWPSRLFEWHTITQLARHGVDPSRVHVEGTPLDDAKVRAAIELWTRFCARSPLAFDEARRSGIAAYPDLATVAEGWGAWFPRVEGGALRLSWADQLLFDGAKAQIIGTLMPWIGDSNVVARLQAWQRHGAFDRIDGLTGHLTAQGERLRDEGTSTLADFAPLDLGGCRINDPDEPWVREPADAGWRVREL